MHHALIILVCVFIIILRRYSRCKVRTDEELDSTPLSKRSDTDLHLAVVLSCAGFIVGMFSLRKSCDGNVWKAVTCLVLWNFFLGLIFGLHFVQMKGEQISFNQNVELAATMSAVVIHILMKYHQSVKRLGSRSGLTSCWDKHFTKKYQQTTLCITEIYLIRKEHKEPQKTLPSYPL